MIEWELFVSDKRTSLTDYFGPPAHPGHSSAQPDRTSAHLM